MIPMIFIGIILNHLNLLKSWILVLYIIAMIIETIVEIVRIGKIVEDY